MVLTGFETTKQGNIALFFDGEFYASVPPELFASARLSVGDEADEQALSELIAEGTLKKAKDRALTLLSYKEYTSKQLQERLERKYEADVAAQATKRMEELGLVNDADYAMRFVRDLSERKKYGALRIRQELRRRGIADELAEQAMRQLEDADPCDQLCEILLRKYPRAAEEETYRRRAFAAMQRLGYRSDDIRTAMRRCFSGEDYLE